MAGLTNMMIQGANQVHNWVQSHAMGFLYKGALVAETAGAVGGIFKIKNETGEDLIVTDVILNVTTAATGTPTVDIGVHAAGTTTDDKLVDGAAIGVAAGVVTNGKHAGTNGGMALWKKDEHIVCTGSASAAGLVGTYTIKAIVA